MELSSKFDAKAIESEIRKYIESIDVEKLIFESDKPEKIMFIEGPPTMNGVPHAGHLRSHLMEDGIRRDFQWNYKQKKSLE
ncbi:MAG: ileS 2 [Candidatus Nitrosotenuis sp.]|nr:ileS 2 [Candidatus Nitrosotenuis sp.]